MLDLIHEGGYSMYFILAIGGAALLLQARRAFAWFVSRDHSATSLARNTATPLYLAAATLLASLGGTAGAFRAVFTFVLEGKHGADVVLMGAYEALACSIVVGANADGGVQVEPIERHGIATGTSGLVLIGVALSQRSLARELVEEPRLHRGARTGVERIRLLELSRGLEAEAAACEPARYAVAHAR